MKNTTFKFVFLVFIALSFQTVSAQFNIKIPKLPKVEKPKQDQTTANDNGGKTSNDQRQTSKSGADFVYKNQRPTNVPVLLKNSIYVQAKTHNEYWKMPNQSNITSWVPVIKFSQFYNNEKNLNYTVEFFNPDGSLWLSDKLEQGTSAADRTVSFDSPNPYENLQSKSSVATGLFSFKITDQDTKQVIYQGKFKVGKFSTGQRPNEKNKFDFFVEHDWLLPFGMVGFHHSDLEIGGIPLEVSFWLKGMVNADELKARIFYKGQELTMAEDNIYKNPVVDYDERTTTFAPPFAPNNIWKRWLFEWHNFRVDNNGTFNRETYPNAFYADKNPGEYTVKIYRNGAQIRELSFTIGADGRIVVPSYSNQIPQPYYRVILPVKIIGTEKWDSVGWKPDAFYGNPLTGFNMP